MRLLPSGPDSRATQGHGLSELEARLQGHTLRLYRMPSYGRATGISGNVPDLSQHEALGGDEKECPRLSPSGVWVEIAVLRLLFADRHRGLLQVYKDIQGAIKRQNQIKREGQLRVRRLPRREPSADDRRRHAVRKGHQRARARPRGMLRLPLQRKRG